MLLGLNNIHKSWEEFMGEGVIKELNDIEASIGSGYTPQADKVLRFMSLDIANIKVVILGQDPYKPEGVANGRAFQPSNLEAWNQPFRQVSLKNMLRNIYASYSNITVYSDIPSYKEVSDKITFCEFGIKQPKEWFDSTEKQGVLWLNTALTCRIGESNSHTDIWRAFTAKVIKYISEKNPNINWFLWGKEAIGMSEYIISGTLYKSRHPMMCSEKYGDDFLRSSCFRDTMGIIGWLG